MYHCSLCLSTNINDSHQALVFKTKEQLNTYLYSPTNQWISGPAGSGKTWLLIEKVKMLAENAISKKNGQKILVVCCNPPLSKMLTETFKFHLTSLLNGDDLRSVVDVKTYSSLLYEITAKCGETDREKDEIVKEAVECLENGDFHLHRYYDHIFVDESQDLYGNIWPDLFEKLWKERDVSKPQAKYKWFFYDTNQYLGSSERQYQQNIITGSRLRKVLRNTGNIFGMSRKYFKSLPSSEILIVLGHTESGLAIKWDQSLPDSENFADSKVTVDVGARTIVKNIDELRGHKVKNRDICVLVVDTEVRDGLISELEKLRVECQDAEKLHEANEDKVVVESVRRFKGLESKVVLLYNPPFFTFTVWKKHSSDIKHAEVKELLYVAVSRCFCYLVVITSKSGYEVLKSQVGMEQRGVLALEPGAGPVSAFL